MVNKYVSIFDLNKFYSHPDINEVIERSTALTTTLRDSSLLYDGSVPPSYFMTDGCILRQESDLKDARGYFLVVFHPDESLPSYVSELVDVLDANRYSFAKINSSPASILKNKLGRLG